MIMIIQNEDFKVLVKYTVKLSDWSIDKDSLR